MPECAFFKKYYQYTTQLFAVWSRYCRKENSSALQYTAQAHHNRTAPASACSSGLSFDHHRSCWPCVMYYIVCPLRYSWAISVTVYLVKHCLCIQNMHELLWLSVCGSGDARVFFAAASTASDPVIFVTKNIKRSGNWHSRKRVWFILINWSKRIFCKFTGRIK